MLKAGVICLLAGDPETALYFVCTYFAVLKAPGVCRTIFNGKRLSRLMVTPPAVNLVDLADLVSVFLGGSEPFRMVMSDIRHWFYQIPVNPFLQKLFGLKLGGDYFKYLVLPMGWSWSPSICQSLAYVIILSPADAKDTLQFCTNKEWKSPPQLVWTASGKGFVTLIYDNIVFRSSCPEELEMFRRLNYERFNVAPKFLDLYPIGDPGITSAEDHLYSEDPATEEYILLSLQGTPEAKKKRDARYPRCPYVVYRGVQVRCVMGKERVYTAVRADPLKIASWKSLELPAVDTPITPISAARFVGRIVHVARIHQRPLCEIRSAIDVLGAAARCCKGDRGAWKRKVFSLDTNQREALDAAWSTVLLNEWLFGATLLEPRSSFESDTQKCYDVQPWKKFNQITSEKIYMKELFAAIFYIKHFIKKGHRNIVVVVVVDNTAAAHSLKNMYSSSAKACGMLHVLHREMKRRGVKLVVVSCRSEDNPADEPSRNKAKDICSRKVAKCRRLVLSVLEGGGRTTDPPSSRAWNSLLSIRHGDCDAEEDPDLPAAEALTHDLLDVGE